MTPSPTGPAALSDPPPALRLALGVLVGLVGLVAMVRLVATGMDHPRPVVWVFVALPILGWVVYSGWRARTSRLAGRSLVAVLLLVVVGLVLVWLGTTGAVAALACSLAGFCVIWVADLRRAGPGVEEFVAVDDLRRPPPE